MFVAGFATTAGSTTLPIFNLVGGTGARLFIREIGISNSTVTEVDVVLARFTTAGTTGTSATTREMDEGDVVASVGVLKTNYSSTAPTSAELGFGCWLGAAKGSGWIWTFAPRELVVPATASNGVGALVGSGTGQVLRAYVKWEEA